MLSPELKSKIDQLWDKFWSRGITNPITAIEQISYLLFMRRLDEIDQKKLNEADFTEEVYDSIFKGNEDLRWSQFSQITDPDEMLSVTRDRVFPFIKNINKTTASKDQEIHPYTRHMENAVFLIANANLLDEAIKSIDEIYIEIQKQQEEGQDFQDTQGDIYEYLLSELKEAGKNGQFRTPRHIIQLMCEIIDPDVTDKICDPACGTGGFLLAAYQHILTKYTSDKFLKTDENGFKRGTTGDKITNKDLWKKLKESTFYGFDIDQTMVRIGLMNLMLHDISIPRIEHRDTLSKKYDAYEADEQYSVVLANPPFTGRIDKGAKSDKLRVKGTQSELLFIDRIVHMLRPGGKAALIVPEGVLFGGNKDQKGIRQILLKDCQLEAVISLPSGAFKPYTGVKTAILVFTKVELKSKSFHTERVWFYELLSDGYSLDDNRRKLKENPLPKAVNSWKNRTQDSEEERKGHHFYVPVSEIKENDYDLSFNRYKEFVYEEQEYDPPKDILATLLKMEKEIQAEMEELNGMIG